MAYQVPALDGSKLNATPMKFALKFKPPAIFMIYQIQGIPKKFSHEFPVYFKDGNKSNL